MKFQIGVLFVVKNFKIEKKLEKPLVDTYIIQNALNLGYRNKKHVHYVKEKLLLIERI
jgi:hypothetical protein